ncbi:MAG: tetratricopeptide repeat protein [Verrucomicrobiota bacterium]|nr:tetratricopeptide repeat protein [Verrucomicrobiota bacterium]
MKKILPLLVLVLAVFGVYWSATKNGFVWDDTALILRDPLIRSWRLIPEGFQHFLFTDATASDFYRPIQRLTYTLDYATFGFRAGPYHLVSVAWHLAAAVALFFFATELLKILALDQPSRRFVPIIAALTWAIHPLQTSAVVYISGRADSLACTFGFLGLYLGLRSLRSVGARWWIFTAGGGISFLLSALSKEMGLIFLALWLVFLLVQRNWKTLRVAGVVSAFVLAIYFSLRLAAEQIAPPVKPPIPPLVRPIVVARAFAEYAGLIVAPINLHMERDVETHPTGFDKASATLAARRELETIAGLVLLGAFVYWLVRERKRDRAVFLLLLSATISYLPVSGIFPLNATIAEHWLYLPTAFLFLAATLWIARCLEVARPWLKPVLLSALAFWLVFLGGRTFRRTFDWKDQRTFLERTVADGGNSARMQVNLAGLEMNEGNLEAARKHAEEALAKDPEQPFAVLSLASVAVKQKDFETARSLLKRAVQMELIQAQAYELLTIIESKETGQANVTRMHLAARTGPPNWSIEKRYVKLLAETGPIEGAIRELQHCLATQWYRADSSLLLSELLEKCGRKSEAASAFARAQAYDVHLAEHPNVP